MMAIFTKTKPNISHNTRTEVPLGSISQVLTEEISRDYSARTSKHGAENQAEIHIYKGFTSNNAEQAWNTK